MTHDTTSRELSAVLDDAAATARVAATTPAVVRAHWLESVADAIDASTNELVAIAHRETSLPEARLFGETARTTAQLRLFAAVCQEGSFLEATIDHATATHPDLRRILTALGPVAVFSASNFPFAFSVAGGDTASAFAAGCPVIVKAHPGHPDLSHATAAVVAEALNAAGGPRGIFTVVYGMEAGRNLVVDPRIRAVGFTGSLAAGRALFDLAASRPDPIPFYGELGSLNPVYVTADAATARAEEIVTGFVNSFTLGCGQFCTKPGLLFVPEGSNIKQLAAEASGALTLGPMLNTQIQDRFDAVLTTMRSITDVELMTGGDANHPWLFATTARNLLDRRDEILEEMFGPASVIVEYKDWAELIAVAQSVPNSLTASVFAELNEDLQPLLATLNEKAGRLIWNGWPTGVAVTWAMHHGGPYPATTAPLHTSVGATAVRRWLRPVTYQDWPPHLLPPELRDDSTLPARVDGTMRATR